MPTSQYSGPSDLNSATSGSTSTPSKTSSTATTSTTTQGGVGNTPDLQADANRALNEARNVAGNIAAEAQTQASALAEQAKAQVAEATEKVKGLASEQKDYLAGQIGGVAEAMDRVASDLEETDASSARYARMLADNAEKLSSTVRDKDVDQLMAIAQDFGRRQPVVFVGAALLLGFAASRFLASSAERRQSEMMDTDTTGYDDLASSTTSTTTSTPVGGQTNGTYTPGGL